MTARISPGPTSGPIDLPIAGRAVCSVEVSRFTPFLRLHFWGDAPDSTAGPDYMLQIEGPLRISTLQEERSIDPEAGADPAYLRLVEKKVARAIALDDGGLDVAFTDGDRLIIPPYDYEAWQLSGDDDSLVVSVAGGGLAAWSGSGDIS
jgi:hypothetical protein